MFSRFGLVLMVNHACNLRCTYCYTGRKFSRAMPSEVGCRAIDRAVGSSIPGGHLDLGFFGGEPLIEVENILGFMHHARECCADRGIGVSFQLTTNGTITSADAWQVMRAPDVQLSISHDGLPAAHDRHRLTVGGSGSSEVVAQTIGRLVAMNRSFSVITVVRPDTVHALPAGIEYLRGLGVRQIDPSLDLWTEWSAADLTRLEETISRCAAIWRKGLPELGLSWFDEKAAQLAGVPVGDTSRCGFGHAEIAVAPSGNLYPCERLIGDDTATNPMRLAGHVLDGSGDFLRIRRQAARCDEACSTCAMQSMCNTTCRCSNYVRTGSVARPDELLCRFNQACLVETARAMKGLVPVASATADPTEVPR